MQRRLSLAVLLLVSVAVAATATALYPDDLLGTWVNVDPLARGLGKLQFAVSEMGELEVYGYGVCSPDFCEWGSTPLVLGRTSSLDVYTSWGIAIWDLDPIKMVLLLSREDDLLMVTMFTYWTDGTGFPYREIALLRQVE